MTPETNPSPFDTAITELKNRIRAMQIALETLEQLRSSPEGSVTGGVSSSFSRSNDNEVRHDTFFEMTIADAARKYLTMMKATKSNADIAAALEQGGLKHSSKDFPTTVRSVLGQREDFIRVPKGDWGLAEWYPGIGRGRKAKADKPHAKARRKKRKYQKRSSEAPPAPAQSAAAESDQGGTQARVEQYITTHPAATSRQIADALSIRVQTVGLILAKIKHRNASATL